MLIRKLILIVILLTAGLTTAQTGVTVTYYTGTTQNFSVETNGKLYFENEELYLKSNSTTTPTVIPVSIIQKSLSPILWVLPLSGKMKTT